ncbi:MAG: Gfo/Idh/MocA family oxidoreductase [Opitutaceae bacterium]|jgi:predicted dehydrogenase|nr:Gfo/Idh/MocA family oxidoreductase [Opitutaceae bacterium]
MASSPAQSAHPPRPTRKQFLRAAGLLCAGIALPRFAGATAAAGTASPNLRAASRAAARTTANSRIRLASIGTGGKGGRNLADFLKNFPKLVECVGVADPKAGGRANGQRIGKLPDSAVWNDFRDMLEKGGIDAVCVSTPDHWHVPATLACIRRGIAVYVEKPLCRTLAEGRLLADTAAALGAKVLVGSQQRSMYPAILKAVRAVRAGCVGELRTIRVLLHKGNPGVPFTVEPVPPSIDYPLWLGPAPDKPYSARRTGGTFRQISDYSEGSISDWGAHHLDIVQMALGMDRGGPSEVEGTGLFPTEGLYDVPYQYDARLYYPSKKVTVVVTTDPKDFPEVRGAKGLTNGIRFEGGEGFVFCDRVKTIASSPAMLDAGGFEGKAINRAAHLKNFIDMITQGAAPCAPAETGHRSATLCHLVYTAVRLRAHLKWNPVMERFEGAGAVLANRALAIPRKEEWYHI